ncbi:hypothetical protein BDA99DRAFT_567420 [Phascolomyces articulosus]|uniref:Uncharacterized protein n=1 Tax=Phascolomyces articulosus TaxID=60185 RepID=A0AAD5L087_9FUNG|nr:hypothetical protein BDA99DRAFT_567420 [Phascolomyces articulosus]
MQIRKIAGLPFIMGALVLTASAAPIQERSTIESGVAVIGADVHTGISPVDDILAALPKEISVPELLNQLSKACVSDVTGKLPEVPVVSDVVNQLPDVCLKDLADTLHLVKRSTIDLGAVQIDADVKTGIPPVDDILAALPKEISVPKLLKSLPQTCVSDVTGKLPEVPVVSDVVNLLPNVCLKDLADTLHLVKRSTIDLGAVQIYADVKTGIPPVDDIIALLPKEISVPKLLKALPKACVSDVTDKLPEVPVVSDVVKQLPDVCLDKVLDLVPADKLQKRHAKELAPKEASNLSAKIIAEIQGNLKAQLSAKVAASLQQSLEASLSVKLNILGGLVKVGNAEINAVQKAALKNLKASIEAKIDAALKTKVFAGAEADLTEVLSTVTGLLPSGLLPEEKLLPIVADVIASVKADLKVQLPAIMADLAADIEAEIEVEIKDLSVTVPLILDVEINANLDIDVEIDLAVKACLSALAKLNVDAAARAVVKDLI